MAEVESKFITRKQGVALVNETLGIPLSLATVNKDVHFKRGPIPDAKYGNRDLYRPQTFLTYASKRVVKVGAS
jgi:hypothetical protein